MDKFFEQFKMTDEFNEQVAEIEELNKQLIFNKVPDGVYKVEVIEMSVKQSKRGNWMIMTLFKVLEGQFENNLMFAYFMINTRNIENNNLFLNALDSKIPVECKSILQYQQLVDDIFVTIRGDKQYNLEVKNLPSGFSNYKILKAYDVEHEPLPFLDD